METKAYPYKKKSASFYGKKCYMGCKLGDGIRLHRFPQNQKKREEWFRIMGKNVRKQETFLCSAHIPDYFVFGNKLSKYAMPNPPEPPKLTDDFSFNSDDITESFNETEIPDEIENTLCFNNDYPCSSEEVRETENPPEMKKNKIEDFEIRHGKTHAVIIKGRCFQTNNYLMVSYTPPKKFSLQTQVKLLDDQCTRQLNDIKIMNKQICFFKKELKKYERLLPKLRFLQKKNRFFYAQLQMYQLQAKTRRKHKKNIEL